MDVVGGIARDRGLGLLELSAQQMSLEERYMELTAATTEYTTDTAPLPALTGK